MTYAETCAIFSAEDTLFLLVDENFSLYHKASAGKSNMALTDGQSYFSAKRAYATYDQEHIMDKIEVCANSHHYSVTNLS